MINSKTNTVGLPRFYQPRPHQLAAWKRRLSGKYNYYFKVDCRQSGKDTDDIQFELKQGYEHPGTQNVYIGLDNVWIRENIWNKTIDGHTHFQEYPKELIEVKTTEKEVRFTNNPPDTAQARVKFIGFLNDSQLIGSSYNNWVMSEASLYKDDAWQFIQPIWENQEAEGKPMMVCINGTPRGTRNIYYDMLRTYTGEDDPEAFPGEHGNCYVEKVTIHDLLVPDGNGGYRRLYSDERIEQLKDRIQRQYGNLNLYYQEYECEFLTVKAGLVYQAIEILTKEERYRSFNLDKTKPVYIAWDISSKGKTTDATACIVYQYINNQMMIYDYYEKRGQSLVECIADLSIKPYFKYIKFSALPWDSERSASSETPIEEARRMYPHINWHALERERVDRGIDQVRRILPNMVINKDNCEKLLDAFMNYEYTFIDKHNDWSPIPKHNWASHSMDAVRYAVMALNEIKYYRLNDDGSYPDLPTMYESMDQENTERQHLSIFYKEPKRTESGLYVV